MIRVQEIQKYLDLGELTLSGSGGGSILIQESQKYPDSWGQKYPDSRKSNVFKFTKVKRIWSQMSQKSISSWE